MPNVAPDRTRCTAQRRSGSFCDLPSLPGAPFPICGKHAREIHTFINDFCDEWRARHADPWPPEPEPTSVVYYVRVGNLIKIGTTTSLRNRMSAYPPDAEVLATETGGYALEAARIAQFRPHLLHGREWFVPVPALMEHIATLA